MPERIRQVATAREVTDQERRDASRTVARMARDYEDLHHLLDVLGLTRLFDRLGEPPHDTSWESR